MLCERFGFRGEQARTLVRDLSGGERRRLQLMRLLMDEPNVLLLDEPTNDLDIDTLTALEDLLDGWPGTLVVVSHDRYFVERVCDDVLRADAATAALRHLPGGIDQYLELRARGRGGGAAGAGARRGASAPPRRAPCCARRARRSRGWSARWTQLGAREAELHEAMAAARPTTPACASSQAELAAVEGGVDGDRGGARGRAGIRSRRMTNADEMLAVAAARADELAAPGPQPAPAPQGRGARPAWTRASTCSRCSASSAATRTSSATPAAW